MITITIEFVCDTCKEVISSVGPYDQPADVVTVVAESLARSHGAQINVASVTCAECLRKPHPTHFVGWTIGDGSGHEGYNVDDFFDAHGNYLGPDEHGIEPIFDKPTTK